MQEEEEEGYCWRRGTGPGDASLSAEPGLEEPGRAQEGPSSDLYCRAAGYTWTMVPQRVQMSTEDEPSMLSLPLPMQQLGLVCPLGWCSQCYWGRCDGARRVTGSICPTQVLPLPSASQELGSALFCVPLGFSFSSPCPKT